MAKSHTPLSSWGAFTTARSVNWLPPACTWNGIDQCALVHVPPEADIGALDGDIDEIGSVMIDDGAGARDHLALHLLRRAVGGDVGADRGRHRQIGGDLAVLQRAAPA